MYLTQLSCKNFRNYHELQIDFSPEINFITGSNGTGKTNILEAISICSNIKSFRNISDSEIMKWDTDNYYCSTHAESDVIHQYEIGCSLGSGRMKKKVKFDGREISRISEYYGKLLTVIFSPIDINLVNGAPEIRRKFIDSVISKTDPAYLESLNEFKRIMVSRNRLLKLLREKKTGDTRQLDVYDNLYAEKSAFIISNRKKFLHNFKDMFSRSYREIAVDDPGPELIYYNNTGSENTEEILDKLFSCRVRDIMSGTSGIGPQRDDIRLQNDSKVQFTNYASQGQRRTAAIALKTAECMYLEDMMKSKAIILVDDIFSELDEERRGNMVKILGRGNQVIFTMVDLNTLDTSSFGQVRKFRVEKDSRVVEL